MLIRQKTILSLLTRAGKPLSPTVFVKLMFLLRHETELEKDRTFYDFVPYRFGPFSFALYWELGSLRQNGYVTPEEDRIALCHRTCSLSDDNTQELPASVNEAVASVVERYGRLSQGALVRHVYARYPWYAINSELPEGGGASAIRPKKALPAVYTAGYEGKSIDAFFNELLRKGIEVVVDVRSNPVSRKYGFSRKHFSEIARKLGLEYRHVPSLGIPSSARANLNGYASYQRLLKRYESTMLPGLTGEISEVAGLMRERPAVLVCVEKDVWCCHRSRLAEAVSRENHLKVIHL
jgi:uncharacterized protein (DUF488 family)